MRNLQTLEAWQTLLQLPFAKTTTFLPPVNNRRQGKRRSENIAQTNQVHAHSVEQAHKFVTTRSAIDNSITHHSQVLEPGASSNPTDPHQPLLFLLCDGGLTALLSQCVSFP